MRTNGDEPDLPREILSLAGPRRVDRLRRALRTGEIDDRAVADHLDGWLALYRRDAQPALRVLVLATLERQTDPRVGSLLHDALDDRGDSVRLEALRQLLERERERAIEHAAARLGDEAVEVCVLAARSLYASDRGRALGALMDLVRREARGPRELHTLRRVLEFLAEEAGDRQAIDAIESLRPHCDDVEGMIDWSLAILRADGGAGA